MIPSAFGKTLGALPQIEKLQKAASALEGDLFKQLLKAAAPKGGLLGGGSGAKIYEDMWQQAVADQAAKGGNLGVAKAIVEKMAPTVIRQAADNLTHTNTPRKTAESKIAGTTKS